MNLDALKARAERMARRGGRARVAVSPEDTVKLLDVHCPRGLVSLRDKLSERRPTHVTFTPVQLLELIHGFTQATEQRAAEAAAQESTNVPRRKRTRVDSKVDPGSD